MVNYLEYMIMIFETPLIFIIKKEIQSFQDELMIPTKGSEESENIKNHQII